MTQILKATLTAKNQITIPKAVRDKLHLDKAKGHDSVDFIIDGDKPVTIKPAQNNNLWQVVNDQAKHYGSVDTPEVDWGPDVGAEDFKR